MDRALSLYVNILQSFDLLQLPKESSVAIIRYPEIDDDYVKFAQAYKQTEFKSNEENWASVAVKNKLRDYCRLLSKAKQYKFETPNSSRNAAKYSTKKGPFGEFVGLKVNLGTFTEIICAFHCFEGMYITYGFTKDYMFLFKYERRRLPLTLYGIIEPLPSINEFSDDRTSLEEIFARNHQTYAHVAKNTNTLCSLKKGQKYRLCCLLDSVLESSDREISPNFGAKDKTIWRTSNDCEDEVEPTFKEVNLDFKNADHFKQTPLTPLSCFFIHYQKAEVEYLLTGDPSDEHSVFLLNRIQYKKIIEDGVDGGVEETVVAGHLRNIALLKHAKEFF